MKIKTLSLITALALTAFALQSCTKSESEDQAEKTNDLGWNISLAQWSLHKSFFGETINDWATFGKYLYESPDSLIQGELDPMDFPDIAKGYGINIIELVNTFYFGKAHDMDYWTEFKKRCDDAGVKVGLIMCDALGNMGDADAEVRQKTVENHYAWVDIAAFLGAETVRVNAGGAGTMEEVADHAVESLIKLGQYGKEKGINIVVENHGGYSSNGEWLSGIMKRVNMDNVGTLPDFGNFCIERGADGCMVEYDMYKGIEELMPFAKGVSAKTNDFNDDGSEADKDYARILQIVKDSGFKGNIGIEYEGNILSEDEGIKATKALIEKIMAEMTQ